MRARSAEDIPGVSVNCASGPPGARWISANPISDTSTNRIRLCPTRRSRYKLTPAVAHSPLRPLRGGGEEGSGGGGGLRSGRPIPLPDIPAVRLHVDAGLVAHQSLLRPLDARILEYRQHWQVRADDRLHLVIDWYPLA